MARAEFVEDDPDEIQVEVVYSDEDDLGLAKELMEPDPFEAQDESVRKLDGLSTSSKRKATRELKKVREGTGGARSKQQEYEPITGYNFFEVAEPKYNLEYLAKLYEVSTAHFAAVNAKVANIVGLGFEWKETNKAREVLRDLEDNEEKLERARRKIARAKGDLLDFLESSNAEDTFLEVLQKIWTDVESTGNGYLEIGRKNNGTVGYLGHVPSHTMRVRLARDGFVQITGERKVIFFHNFGHWQDPNPLSSDPRPNEIIHFKKYSPTDSYYGVPDIVAALNAVAGNEFASRFNLDYFEHKAIPKHIIVVKGAKLSGESEAKLVEFFQTGLKGKHHRTIYVPLPATAGDNDKVDFKLEKVEADMQDASFIKYYNKNRDEILMAHRVPLTKVGLAEGVSLAVARDADKMFKEQVCRPAQDIIEKKLRRLFGEMSDALKFHLKELTLTDEDTMSKIWERYLKTLVVTPNEVREALGWKGREGGDEPLPVFAKNDPTQQARETAQSARGRERDSSRSANATDSAGEGRNAKGEGRTE
jgi:PBSX family phage portal protein